MFSRLENKRQYQDLISQKATKYNPNNNGVSVRFGRYYQTADEAMIAIFHKMMDHQNPNDLNDWEILHRSHT